MSRLAWYVVAAIVVPCQIIALGIIVAIWVGSDHTTNLGAQIALTGTTIFIDICCCLAVYGIAWAESDN